MDDIVGSVELGFRIKQLRQQAGLSQENLAEMVGVTFQQIQKYENGHTTLNILKLQQIAKALQHTLHDFFDDKPVDRVRLSEQEESLLQAFRRIKSPEIKQSLLTIVVNTNRRSKPTGG